MSEPSSATSNLVSRLRGMYADRTRNHEHWLNEAADEIERLARELGTERSGHLLTRGERNWCSQERERLLAALNEELDWHMGIGPTGLETVTERIQTLRATLSGDGSVVETSGWRPIQTAPRDGTPFIGYSKTHGVVETSWEQVDGGGHPENGPPIYWWTSPHVEFIDGPYDAPTHWMPLQVPSAEETSASYEDEGRETIAPGDYRYYRPSTGRERKARVDCDGTNCIGHPNNCYGHPHDCGCTQKAGGDPAGSYRDATGELVLPQFPVRCLNYPCQLAAGHKGPCDSSQNGRKDGV